MSNPVASQTKCAVLAPVQFQDELYARDGVLLQKSEGFRCQKFRAQDG
jgi:hypothetical protein